MSRRFSLQHQHSTLVTTALLTAALLEQPNGFLPRDVEFYFNLYANWLEFRHRDNALDIELIQITRMLSQLRKDKHLTIVQSKTKKRYHFHFDGYVFLLKQMVEPRAALDFEYVTFIRYILRSYGGFIHEQIFANQKFVSSSKRNEVETLLNPDTIARNQILVVDEMIKDLKTRIEESQEMTRFADRELKSGKKTEAIIDEMSKQFTYQLSHQKSFRDLYRGFKPTMKEFELKSGMQVRNESLFEPLLKHYTDVKENLLHLV